MINVWVTKTNKLSPDYYSTQAMRKTWRTGNLTNTVARDQQIFKINEFLVRSQHLSVWESKGERLGCFLLSFGYRFRRTGKKKGNSKTILYPRDFHSRECLSTAQLQETSWNISARGLLRKDRTMQLGRYIKEHPTPLLTPITFLALRNYFLLQERVWWCWFANWGFFPCIYTEKPVSVTIINI